MYNLGVEAYNAENYEKALNFFQKASSESTEAHSYIPLCYLNIASEVSCAASASDDTETTPGRQTKL